MKKKVGWIILISLLSCLFYSVGFSCKYTVHDIGFTDIGSVPYKVYYYIREDTPKDLISEFKSISYATFMDSNVEVEIINIDQQKNHQSITSKAARSTLRYIDFWDISSFPAAVLVSPKGRSLVLPISKPNKSFKETGWRALENVVSSPKRKEILQNIVGSYCVVLFIRGKKVPVEMVTLAKEAVTEAIDDISKVMRQMPASIETPPYLVTISPESFSEEEILLWSLGIDENELSKPYVAVLYGRGRRIGPLLKGEKITKKVVSNILSVIGASCECGLDRGSILGTMLPFRWNEKRQSEVVKSLGFDAESPMVKTEMSQILSMGTTNSGNNFFNEYSEKSVEIESGYSEESVEFEDGTSGGMISPAQLQKLNSPKSQAKQEARSTNEQDSRSTSQIMLFMGGGIMVLLILSVGVFIVLRARRRAS